MTRIRPLPFALLVLALDAVWALHAFSAVPRHGGSNVAMVSLIVWSTLHLPAAILGGLLLRPFGVLDHGAAGLPGWSLAFMAGLGLLQSFGLAYGLAWWWRRRGERLGA
jgi:hypothetical protein